MGGRISQPGSADPVKCGVKTYCITDSLDVAARAARDGVEMIQIRAKEFSARELGELVRGVLRVRAKARFW